MRRGRPRQVEDLPRIGVAEPCREASGYGETLKNGRQSSLRGAATEFLLMQSIAAPQLRTDSCA